MLLHLNESTSVQIENLFDVPTQCLDELRLYSSDQHPDLAKALEHEASQNFMILNRNLEVRV